MTANPGGAEAWRLLGAATWRTGFAYGLHYPSLELAFSGEELDRAEADRLARALIAALPPMPQLAADWDALPKAPDASGAAIVATAIMLAIGHMQCEAGLPVFESGRLLFVQAGEARIVVPAMLASQFETIDLIRLLVDACRRLRAGEKLREDFAAPAEWIERVNAWFGFHGIVHQFARSALRGGVPFVELPMKMLQFGQGKNGQRLINSVTERTTKIAALLGRNKHAAAQLLREAGIPVPEHFVVTDEKQATVAANQLGYPVVVKPADLDGGEGVSADLRDLSEVLEAFALAKALSPNVLVEKHVEGRDYRITVFNGEVIWVVERVPGGVIGDGRSSIAELVAELNRDPRRQEARHAFLKPLHFDDEARLMIERAGLAEASVPPAGAFVRLRRASNVRRGGWPIAVNEQLHPDNARLAIRAAAVAGSDLCGIDLLIPDIARSWMETGAHVCEINPGPEIGLHTNAHIYGPILGRLVRGNGRIPIALILGAAPGSALDALSSGLLDAPGLTIGRAGPGGVTLAGEALTPGAVRPFSAGQMLAHDRRSEGIVLGVDGDDLLTTGLPFPRFDILVVAGFALSPDDPQGTRSPGQIAVDLVTSLLPACDGTIVVLPEVGMQLQGYAGAAQVRDDLDAQSAARFVAGELSRLAGEHAAARPFPPLKPIYP